jgi:hypothetical protein
MSLRVRPSLHEGTPLQDAVRALGLLPQMATGNVKSMLSQSTDCDQSVQDKLMVQPDKAWAKEQEQEHVVKVNGKAQAAVLKGSAVSGARWFGQTHNHTSYRPL